MSFLTWRRYSHGPAVRLFAQICNHDRPQVRTPDEFVLRRTSGYNILAKRKDALASWVEVLDMFAAIWGL